MPEKMTQEAIEGVRQRMDSGETMTAMEQRAVLAHIAAVETERGDIQRTYETVFGSASKLGVENGALRERVQALEKDVASVTAERDTLRVMGSPTRLEQPDPTDAPGLLDSLRRWRAGARAANARALAVESRLAAIRQRAGDREAAFRSARTGEVGWMDRILAYVVGEDATVAAVDCVWEGPAHPEQEHDPSYAPEPSTSEAPETPEALSNRVRLELFDNMLEQVCQSDESPAAALERLIRERNPNAPRAQHGRGVRHAVGPEDGSGA